MKVLHVITGLNDGGAEGVLYRLITNDKSNAHTVISLMDEGKYGPLLENANIPTYYLRMNKSIKSLKAIIKLRAIIKKEKPHIIQTWMSHSDLIAGLVAKSVGFNNIVWNIRHTKLENNLINLKTNAVIYSNMLLSRVIPKKIICCSKQTFIDFKDNGYSNDKMTIISNGYDFNKFHEDPELRALVRNELNIPEDTVLLGRVARYGINKNHLGLLEALSLIKNDLPEFKLLLVGKGLDPSNKEISNKIAELELSSSVILLGQHDNIPAIMNAIDLHISNSASGEGFPNALTEAMSCGTLCVATDVGDSALIIGNNGWIVRPSNSAELAQAIRSAIQIMSDKEQWHDLKNSAQKHIRDNFSLATMISKYNQVWKDVASLT